MTPPDPVLQALPAAPTLPRKRRRRVWLALPVAAVTALVLFGWGGAPSGAPVVSGDLGLPAAVDTAFNATVVVHTEDGNGSAVAIAPTVFLTAEHVVEYSDAAEIELADGTVLEGAVIHRDARRDLALVETRPHGLHSVPVADRNPGEGDFVYAFGAPNEYVQMSSGLVTGVYDADENGVEDVETDTAIRHGNSGGPLVNTRGDIVGIVSYGFDGVEEFGYAISVAEIRSFMRDAGLR